MILNSDIIYLLIITISIIQSIAGVGVLVLGTPLMLILEFSIIDVMYFLLPISIASSLINLIIINFIFNEKIEFREKVIKHFFIICLISLLLGLYLLKTLSNIINFNLIVSLIIILSIFIKFKFINSVNISKNLRKFFLFVIGIVHGLTNSGGTLLTLLFFDNKKGTRGKIHFFYFVLASVQLIFLYIIHDYERLVNFNFIYIFMIVLISSLVGNYFVFKFKKDVNLLIYILAVVASTVLLTKNFIY